MKRAMLLALLLFCALVLAPFMAALAQAHEWYSDKKDPKLGSCCSGLDCAPWKIERGQLTPESYGFRVRMTREQVLAANPSSKITHVDQYFPLSRLLESEDGNWHACPKFAGTPDDALRCLIAPPNM